MNRPSFALISLVLAAAAPAQALTVSADVTQLLAVGAAGNPSSQQSVPVGPLPPAGAAAHALTSTSSAYIEATPNGSSDFRLRTVSFANLNFFVPAGFNQSGEIVLTLTMPTPTPVVIALSGTSLSLGGGGCSTEVDIDNDGSIEATLSTSSIQPSSAVDGEFGLLVGPAGRAVRLRHFGTGTPVWNSVTASSDLLLSFYPAAAPVSAYGPGCINLSWTRGPSGDTTFRCPAAAGSLAFFAFGLNPMQLPVPIAPGCFQLTDVLFSIAGVPAGGEATFVQAPLALPPGFRVNVQAAVIDLATGVVVTSNGLAMIGPS